MNTRSLAGPRSCHPAFPFFRTRQAPPHRPRLSLHPCSFAWPDFLRPSRLPRSSTFPATALSSVSALVSWCRLSHAARPHRPARRAAVLLARRRRSVCSDCCHVCLLPVEVPETAHVTRFQHILTAVVAVLILTVDTFTPLGSRSAALQQRWATFSLIEDFFLCV